MVPVAACGVASAHNGNCFEHALTEIQKSVHWHPLRTSYYYFFVNALTSAEVTEHVPINTNIPEAQPYSVYLLESHCRADF
jgi:hypothetical protein